MLLHVNIDHYVNNNTVSFFILASIHVLLIIHTPDFIVKK